MIQLVVFDMAGTVVNEQNVVSKPYKKQSTRQGYR